MSIHAMIRVVWSAFVLTAHAQQEACPAVSSNSFNLPQPTINMGWSLFPTFDWFQRANSGDAGGGTGGMHLEDVNGDGLVDLIVSISVSEQESNPNTVVYLSCVYLNTGLGWASAADFHDPDSNGCLVRGVLRIRHKDVSFHRLATHEFQDIVASTLKVPADNITILNARGIEQGHGIAVASLAAHGFTVRAEVGATHETFSCEK